MKCKIISLAILLFVSQICFAQNDSGLKLVEVLGRDSCESVRGRTDEFLIGLRENPNATGYVIFYAGENLSTFAFYENAFKSHIKFRRFPEERIKFISVKSEKDFKIEFWMSESDAKPKVFEDAEDSFLILRKNRQIFSEGLFETSKSDGKLSSVHESECNIETLNFSLLAKFLKANPQATAQVLVYNKKRFTGEKIIRQFLAEAVKDFQIPRGQIEIFYAGIDKDLPEYYPKASTVKVWLVSKGDTK